MVDTPGQKENQNDAVEPELDDVEGHSVEEETGDADASAANFNIGCCC